MKKLLSIILLAIAIYTVAFTDLALAADPANGAKIFNFNCVACHKGGGNLVMANKNLKKQTLQKYGMDSMEAVTYQVKNGKYAMPAFGGRLRTDEIEDVAAYVLEQADKGW